MSALARARLLVLLATGALVLVVWAAVRDVTAVHERVRATEDAVEALLTFQLDMETGLRGFAQTGQEEFLEPYEDGLAGFGRAAAAAEARGATPDLLDATTSAAVAWQRSAAVAVEDVRAEGAGAVTADEAGMRKRIMDRFRARHTRLVAHVRAVDARRIDAATHRAVLLVLGVCIVAGLLGVLFVERRMMLERRGRRLADELTEALQGAATEDEAHDLLQRHIARVTPGARSFVLTREEGGVRLRDPRGQDDEVAARLRRAAAGGCLAMRRGVPYERSPGADPLQACAACGDVPGGTSCVPSVVGGQVTGAVLTVTPRRLREDDARSVRGAVERTTPLVANLRNLALAERLAATDALTGLPNRRALEDAMGHMLAQADRADSTLSAIVLDLDRFKALNDEHGHQAGDQALAAVGTTIATSLRASDVAGRSGGEEFLVLLPDTDAEGAAIAAEKLRAAIGGVVLPVVPGGITASLGVATFPDHAASAEELVGAADKAMYEAKRGGRDRVVPAGDARGHLRAVERT